jgi:sulfide:quinone oxidoreductase
VGTPKAGVFAEGQAIVVADALIARHRAGESASRYSGRGICYLEFGDNNVGRVEVTFRKGERPDGHFDDPSALYTADKSEFGSSRIRRWFGRDWVAY